MIANISLIKQTLVAFMIKQYIGREQHSFHYYFESKLWRWIFIRLRHAGSSIMSGPSSLVLLYHFLCSFPFSFSSSIFFSFSYFFSKLPLWSHYYCYFFHSSYMCRNYFIQCRMSSGLGCSSWKRYTFFVKYEKEWRMKQNANGQGRCFKCCAEQWYNEMFAI